MGKLVDHLSTRKQEVLQADPRSASMAGRILAAVNRQPAHQNRRIAELDDPPRYAEIFRLLLMSSIFRRWGRPIGPGSAGITSRQDA